MPRLFFLLIVLILLQLLTAVFAQSLRWILGRGLINFWSMAALYLISNGLLILALSRVFHGGFAIFASILTLLWIWFMAAAPVYLLQKLLPASALWKAALPLSFFALTAWGWYNAHTLAITRYSITLDKPTAPFRILLASDLHLGVQNGNAAIDRLRSIAEQETPDLILLPGDIINDDAAPYLAQHMAENLGKLHAPYGVYITLGNHEHYGELSGNIRALRQSGHTLLLDQSIQTHGITIIGREDNTNPHRKPITALLPADTSHPIIVLDHQPKDIDAISQQPIDLTVSGHTHRGQIFPANFITQYLYRLDYGHAKIGSGHFITTSGYGFWGVPLRLGSQSEIVIIDVKAKNNESAAVGTK